MYTKKPSAIATLLLFGMSHALFATASTPQSVIESTSTHVFDALRKNKVTLDKEPGRLYELVHQVVIPSFDFDLMSRWVLGKAWQNASAEQRSQFTDGFRTLLVRTYAKALLEYTNDDVRILPQQAVTDGGDATVKTEVKTKSGKTIPINYTMRMSGGAWKVFDVSVDGVSLVTNYRGVFASQIREKGMDGVIADLRQRNAKGAR